MISEFQKHLEDELRLGKRIEIRRNGESKSTTLELEVSPKEGFTTYIVQFIVSEYGSEIFRTEYLWKACREFEDAVKRGPGKLVLKRKGSKEYFTKSDHGSWHCGPIETAIQFDTEEEAFETVCSTWTDFDIVTYTSQIKSAP
jgi:hypothetical protein